MKTARHPALPHTITFDPARHTYTDDSRRRYLSVTSWVRSLFPEFDAPSAAERVAARTGRLALDVLREWGAKRDASAAYGTAVHAYAEAAILGRMETVSPPATDNEARARLAVDAALLALADTHDILGAEMIVFDPLYRLAGTLDLPAVNRATGALAILDWKTCEEITDDAWGRTGLPPLVDVPDSKAAHYAIQLSTYATIMRDTGYVEPDRPVELAVIHVAPGSSVPAWMPLGYYREQVERAVTHRWGARIVPEHPGGMTPEEVGAGDPGAVH
jgi:hypothetical protein